MKFHATKGFLKDLLTGKDGASFDIGRVIWAVMCLAYIGLTVYSIHKGGTIDFVSWATGAGLVQAAGAGALALKAATEPGMPPAPVPTTPAVDGGGA